MSQICSREQRQNDDRRNLGDPCRSAVGNCAQEDDGDGRRVAEQLVGAAFVQDGQRWQPCRQRDAQGDGADPGRLEQRRRAAEVAASENVRMRSHAATVALVRPRVSF